jgi:hypothetical protein
MIVCIPFFEKDISWFKIIDTALLPVLLFFLGVWTTKFVERQREKNNYKRLEKYFIGLLNQLSKKNKEQISLLDKAANRTDEFEKKDLAMEINSSESHKLLKELDRSKLYSGYILSRKNNINEKSMTFERIVSMIDYLWYLHESFKPINDELTQAFNNYQKRWNTLNEELTKAIINLFSEANSTNITNDPFLNEINKHLQELKQFQGKKLAVDNIEDAYNVFVRPLLDTMSKFPRDSKMPTIFVIVDRLQVIYLQMRLDIENNRKNAITRSNDIKIADVTLNNLINDFKRYSSIGWSDK